jgi:hypothetical protein
MTPLNISTKVKGIVLPICLAATMIIISTLKIYFLLPLQQMGHGYNIHTTDFEV